MRLVILESPYAGDTEANVAYARACVRDSLMRGEAPIASHLLYTQPGILNDADPRDRELGIAAGLAWKSVAHASVVYMDRGLSGGMQRGIEAATAAGLKVDCRLLKDRGGDDDPVARQKDAALRLVYRFLNPEDLGFSVPPIVRDLAREVIGLQKVETEMVE